MKRERPVCIEWNDAAYNSGYYDKDKPELFDPVPTKSIGFIVERKRDRIILCMDRFYSEGKLDDERHICTIPKKMIKRIVPLKEDK
jgi:hypothetical protein